MMTVQSAASRGQVASVCAALSVSRASYYRWLRGRFIGPRRPRTIPRKLSAGERAAVLEALHSERFADKSPAQITATLLDDGQYLCSERTMYRVLAEADEVRERRDQLRHPAYAAPELLAEKPNQLWSWDITKLMGPAKWTYFHLYVILDVFSRYVVGWTIAHRESKELAKTLIDETLQRQKIGAGELTIHADRGAAMTSKPVAFLMADLGVTKTHSRPHVSNDNPFSEAQFKTAKYMPGFPQRFGSIEDCRTWARSFFAYYNDHHRHSGIAMMTPHDVHHGLAEQVAADRQSVLKGAFQATPERFVKGPPKVAVVPRTVWINPPKSKDCAQQEPADPNASETRGTDKRVPRADGPRNQTEHQAKLVSASATPHQ